MNKKLSMLFWLWLTLSPKVLANNDSQVSTANVGSWHFGASFGYGKLSSPLSDNNDIELYVLPDIRYFGERFYLENTSIGYSLKETASYSIDLVGFLNRDGLYFPNSNRSALASIAPPIEIGLFPADSRKPLSPDEQEYIYPQEKSLSYMTGVTWRYLGDFNMSSSLAADISAGHHGYEFATTISKPLQLGKLMIEPMLGVNYKSSDLVHYYYGIEPNDLPDGYEYFSYQASSAINWHAQLQLGYPLGEKLWLVTSYRYDHNDNEIANSPIVTKEGFHAWFAGIKWSM